MRRLWTELNRPGARGSMGLLVLKGCLLLTRAGEGSVENFLRHDSSPDAAMGWDYKEGSQKETQFPELGGVSRKENVDDGGSVPSVRMYATLLQDCCKRKDLARAKLVQSRLAEDGLEAHRFLGDLVVTTFIKCGGFADGLCLFRRLVHRTVFSWTAVISGYSDAGQFREALVCYEQMQQEGVEPNEYTFVSVLKVCSRLRDLNEGKRIHADAVRRGFGSHTYVASTVMSMYAKCGSLVDAQQVFDRLTHRDVVSWNVMLAAYAQEGEGERTLQFYAAMKAEGVRLNAQTFASALQACGALAEQEEGVLVDGQYVKAGALDKGRGIHAEAVLWGLDSDMSVCNTLVSMYAKCGSIALAEQVFGNLSQRNVVSWTAMITAYVHHRQGEKALQVYAKMQEEGILPNSWTLVSALQACGTLAEEENGALVSGNVVKLVSLQKGKDIHMQVARLGYGSDVLVISSLFRVYAKCGCMKDAEQAFATLPHKDVVSWNSMIAAYTHQGQGEQAWLTYRQMLMEAMEPDAWTFVSTLQACSSLSENEQSTFLQGQEVKLESLQKGKQLHAEAVESGFDTNKFVASTLVSMYAKCGSVRDAREMFDKSSHCDVVAWNAMIAAYAEQQQGEKCLQIFSQMLQKGFTPDSWTLIGALQACGILAGTDETASVPGSKVKMEALRKGKEIHAQASLLGYDSDLSVSSALVSMYAQCGNIAEAKQVFDGVVHPDVPLWNTMIAAYARQGQGEKALQVYEQMQAEGVELNEATLLSVLEACSSTGALNKCRQAHQIIVNSRLQHSRSVANNLIHTYGRCGSMVDAQLVFNSVMQPNVVSWTALLAGYARQGDCMKCVQTYEDMCLSGIKPDRVTFTALLCACSHAGMVEEGQFYFESMTRDHRIYPDLEHYVCMVDLFARAGLFDRAECLILEMPMQPPSKVWLCLLGACRIHGNVALGRRAFNRAVESKAEQAAAYSLMTNIYADAGMWEFAKEIEDLRQRAGAWKEPGKSWIEHDQEVHTFLVRDCRHEHQALLYELLQVLTSELKKAGNALNVQCLNRVEGYTSCRKTDYRIQHR